MTKETIARLLVLVALIVFALATFSVPLGGLALVPLGLAIYMASRLFP